MIAKVSPHKLSGRLSVPGSKSHTIRAVCIATMAEGESVVNNPLPSQDCFSALRACEMLGAKTRVEEGSWLITGTGGKLQVPDNVIDVGNSGTTLYFITAMASLLPSWTVITGDDQIRNRPILPLLEALSQIGAEGFTTRNTPSPPVVIKGPIHPGTVWFDGKFSQYISATLLVAPLLNGVLRIEVADPKERPYLKMTGDWMEQQGIAVDYDRAEYRFFEVLGPQQYKQVNTSIPSDWESVAFPMIAAAITDSKITFENLDFSWSQGDQAIVEIMEKMGTDLNVDEDNGIMTVKGGSPLRGLTIDCSDIPDAVPILAVAACFAQGTTKLTNLEMVRAKETDRVALMNQELTKMGAKIEETYDSLIIEGSSLQGAEVDSHGDHRIAMALVVAGLASPGETWVHGAQSVAVSFPNFFEVMNNLEANINIYYEEEENCE